jgi:hypothetical protein
MTFSFFLASVFLLVPGFDDSLGGISAAGEGRLREPSYFE